MTGLKKNVSVFDADARENTGYRYTTGASFSSTVANRRMTEATLQWIGEDCRSVLDAGCGDGTYANDIRLARPRLEITGVDPAAGAIEAARKRYPGITFFVGDILRPGTFTGKRFDLVIMRGVLHHLSDPAAALRHCAGLADRILIIEPNGNNPILKAIEQLSSYHREHEERSFPPRLLRRWCREAGLDVAALDFIGFVPFFFPTLPAKIIYFFQPFLERVPLVGRFFGAQTVILCRKK
ncbi:MAG: hypothetical protein A2X28_11295 [Elusimicrobia bacterium GWA2_56_46]|nr:MAG: hypothetical protein A2X28_11295 [Elusimicrobia bacterium GWA2_56_46]OGR54522.1 MAG: hypothetical protein A2X39_10080 [Elusimicrobia bacterium GWC2_56_31]HBB68193.1 class I SAM-dependent methyltransferase [Elusimicrobiota bacterium]HBW22324.1 class I SAM-dependent methyltransferase [Elusimicrobiota bacterium]